MMRQQQFIIKIGALLVLLGTTLFATEGSVKVFLPSTKPIYTSQKMIVSVEIACDALSITDAKIDFTQSGSYVLQAPKSASYLRTDEIDGKLWQVVHYDYELFALKAGTITVPPASISFTGSMGYGQPKQAFTLQSKALQFDVHAPSGVKANQFVLVTDSYTLEVDAKLDTKRLIVGDAMELSVTQKAHNVPDILLQPVRYASNAFVRVYPKEPQLQSNLVGTQDVSRVDAFTFVASTEGNVSFPSQTLLWWNPDTQALQTQTIPAFVVEILPDPKIAIDIKKSKQKIVMFYVAIFLGLAFLAYVLFASRIRHYFQERKTQFASSEAGRFASLLICIEEDNPKAVYEHFYAWLGVIAPELAYGGFTALIKQQPSFAPALHQLGRLLSDNGHSLDKITFTNETNKLRATLLKEQTQTQQTLTKHLNP